MEPFQKCIIIHHFSSENYVDFENHNHKSWKSSHELLGAEIGAIPKFYYNTSFYKNQNYAEIKYIYYFCS